MIRCQQKEVTILTPSNPSHEAPELIAYDLALRIKGLHLYPQISEQQALEVFDLAKELQKKLRARQTS
jgi:UDP-N-acetylmuramyl tripeptide synthase